MYRAILFALAAFGLAGCMTVTNTVSLDDIATFRLAGVEVRHAPDVHIWWGDGERAFAASKGLPATESETLAKTPEGQAYLRSTIAAKMKAATERSLAGSLTGVRPVRVEVTVKQVVISSTIQRIIIGGHHHLTADVTLVDARSGAVIISYAAKNAMAGGGQGLMAIADAAILPDPLDRVIDIFAGNYANWLLRKGPPVDMASSASGGIQ